MPRRPTAAERERDRRAAELRTLLATARRNGYATVVDDVVELLGRGRADRHEGCAVLRRVREREDLEAFGFVLQEIVARYPESWLRGFGDGDAAVELAADEDFMRPEPEMDWERFRALLEQLDAAPVDRRDALFADAQAVAGENRLGLAYVDAKRHELDHGYRA